MLWLWDSRQSPDETLARVPAMLESGYDAGPPRKTGMLPCSVNKNELCITDPTSSDASLRRLEQHGNDPMLEKPAMKLEQLIAWTLWTHPLENPPRDNYAYSNFGCSDA